MREKILVVAAHAGDYVWRCGGTIAKYAVEGSIVKIVVLSDGLRGEANSYWRSEGANEKEGSVQRRAESTEAAHILGVEDIEFWGLRDYPMEMDCSNIERLAHICREFRPDFIVTHDAYDAFNPDHNITSDLVRKSCATASGAGFRDGCATTKRQIPIFGFEPHLTEISGFRPTEYVDISETFQLKCQAMRVYASQPSMYETYVRKAETRGAEAAVRGGRSQCKYAEAFSIYQPIAASGRFVW